MVAAAIGLLNGLCIKRLNMSPFVPTLASLAIARSLALIITRGAPDFDFRRRISGASLDRRRRHLRHSETFSYLPFSGDRWLDPALPNGLGPICLCRRLANFRGLTPRKRE
jgi:hypothetical protein